MQVPLAFGLSMSDDMRVDMWLGAGLFLVFCLFPLSPCSLLSHTREETVNAWSTIFSHTRSVSVTGRRSL